MAGMFLIFLTRSDRHIGRPCSEFLLGDIRLKTSRILVAGIGNIFLGDNAFGVETVRSLSECELPEQVSIVDFGVRSYDLAYALADDSERKAILVDASPRGDPPGTLYLIEPDIAGLSEEDTVMNVRTLNPMTVLLMARSLNRDAVRPGNIYVIGCEPAVLETEEGSMELSPPVRSAVPAAVEMIRALIDRLLSPENNRPSEGPSNGDKPGRKQKS